MLGQEANDTLHLLGAKPRNWLKQNQDKAVFKGSDGMVYIDVVLVFVVF